MTTTTAVSLEVDAHGVAVLTLNNPPVNAHSVALFDGLIAALDDVSYRQDVRVVILTGKGKVFCAGADLKEIPTRPGDTVTRSQDSRRAREAFNAITECHRPVIAALNGPALGGGLAIAASCDMLIASEQACMGLPEIDIGALGGARHAQRLFSHSRLRRMVLTGKRIYGPELYRLGVIEDCVPADQLKAAARTLAEEIAGKSPTAVRMAKQTLNQIESMTLREGYRFEQLRTRELGASDDAKEIRRARAEGRAPVFKGS